MSKPIKFKKKKIKESCPHCHATWKGDGWTLRCPNCGQVQSHNM